MCEKNFSRRSFVYKKFICTFGKPNFDCNSRCSYIIQPVIHACIVSLFTCIYIQSPSIFSSVKINTNDISNLIHDINKPVYVLTGVEWLTYPHLTVTVSLLKCFYRKEHQFFFTSRGFFCTANCYRGSATLYRQSRRGDMYYCAQNGKFCKRTRHSNNFIKYFRRRVTFEGICCSVSEEHLTINFE